MITSNLFQKFKKTRMDRKPILIIVAAALISAVFWLFTPGGASAFTCGDNVTFNYRGQQVTYGTVTSTNAVCWMNRNLGASTTATAYNDGNAYGDLFQWGRLDDGHQATSSATTTTLSGTNVPGNNLFISGMGSPYDWLVTQSDSLWQASSSYANNPCPAGWRVPTYDEWSAEESTFSPQSYVGAYNSPLKLTAAGSRYYSNGSLSIVGAYGSYWSSTVSGTFARYLYFNSSVSYMGSNDRAFGLSVRCLQDSSSLTIRTISTIFLATTTGQTINVHNDLTIGDGTNTGIVTGNTYSPILNIDGNLNISASSTLIASTSVWYVAKNWTNLGTFTAASGTVNFDDSGTSIISGANTFYNLTATTSSKVLQFATGTSATTTVTGALTLSGGDCGTKITLLSTQAGQYWYLNAMSSISVAYVDVKDSNATGSASVVTATNSTDSIHNVNWSISTCAAAITISGTVYSDEGQNYISTQPIINLYVNSTFVASTTATTTDGNYSIPNVSATAGQTITVYLDNNAATGTTVTLASSSNMTGIDIYKDRIIVRDDNTQAGLAIADMVYWDKDNDADIKFTATTTGGNSLTVDTPYELYVWGSYKGKFKPNGNVTTYDLKIASSTSVYTASGTEAITVAGSWWATSSASFVAATSTVTFTSTLSTATITTGGSSFYNLTFNGAGGTWTFQDAATTSNDLTVTAGTASSSYNMNVLGGDVTGNGTLYWASSTFMVGGTGNLGGTQNWNFYNLTFSGTTTATSTGTTTISNVLTIAVNQTLNAGEKPWVLSGAGTPFVKTGTFTAATSTFYYTNTNNATVTAAIFYNLNLSPAGTPTYNLTSGTLATNNNLIIGNGVNGVIVNATTNNPTIDVNGYITISTSSILSASTTAFTVAGNWTNSGTFAAGSSTVTFDATTTGAIGKTISGTLNSTSSFYKLTFNGTSSAWTITDPIRITAPNATDTLLIKQGTVTLGNGPNDDLEVLGGFIVGDGSGYATFTTAAINNASGTITININASSSPIDCSNCIISIASSTSNATSTFKLSKNTILRFNSYSSVQSGLEVESQGYLWIEGEQMATNTVSTTSEDIASTTITASSASWTTDQFAGMHLRISNTVSTTTAFGKIYDIASNTASTIRINATTSVTSTIQSITGTNASSTRTICSTSTTMITADNEGIGRYLYDHTATTGYFKIIDSTNDGCSGKDSFVVIAEPDAFSALATGNVIDITDGINTNDQFEILDYVQVTASSTAHGYIYAKSGSETLIRYADISELGKSTPVYKYGVSFYSVNGSHSNEGVTIEKSRIHNGYRGIYLEGSSNNTSNKGFSNNAVYGNTNYGFYVYLYSNNNTFTSNNSYGNSYGFYLNSSDNNTLTSNNSYGNSNRGFYLISSHSNTLTSNNSYGNTNYGFYLYSSTNNTLTSNNSYGNSNDGFFLQSSSNNNTLTSNNSYGNGSSGFDLQSSSRNNTFILNNSYGNSNDGFFLYSSSNNNTFASNNSYGNSQYGFRTENSANTILINETYSTNTQADVYFSDSGATGSSTVRCYGCTLNSTTKVSANSIIATSSYFISYNQNGISTSTQIWGEYFIPTDDTRTPQNESINRFSYATSTWPDSIARVNYYGTGNGSSTSVFDFVGDYSTSSATYRVAYSGPASSTWYIYRNETYIATTSASSTYTDNYNLRMQIATGTTAYATSDTYVFTAFKGSNNTSTQKYITMMQDGDKFTVGSGKTLEIKGGGSGAAQITTINYNPGSGFWSFYNDTDSELTFQEATISSVQFTSGTTTVLNTVLNNESVTSTAALNVDWYLGIHVVAIDSTSTDIDNATCTISSTSTAEETVWKHNGTDWGTAATSQIIVTQPGPSATGTNPQPNNDGAIRIREYKKTSTATTTYKYNLEIDPPAGFVAYDYWEDFDYKYIASTLSTDADVNLSISENWQRNTIGNLNGSKDYDGLNLMPEHGTWYAGITSDLQFSISSPTLNLTLEDPDWTATGTTILYATTTYYKGFIIKAHMWDTQGKLATSTPPNEIIRWDAPNATPTAWDSNCPSGSSYCGFGYTTDDNDLIEGYYTDRFTNNTRCGAAAGNKCWAGFATTSPYTDLVGDRDNPSYGATTTITYKVSVDQNQPPANYVGTVYYICTVNY